ncbi:Orange domain,Myc-type, basic helix-loop-helix (bHLH) domain [Cinara cedri]|uniref:Orange domain,Myc-type, basic helix-loop-helix (BHLH) domain n=1 Tax=Cinara cedri TaxID=506608 RepID=A0A5E4MWN2_9HEMI|nr:Orange domain,Myc-type, basic helix-loop-helix (bHLH) domain [Cinara cedri]
MRPVAELRPSYRVQMHMMQQQQQQQHQQHAAQSSSDYDEQPVSRTYQYRKVMKPLLERKRRARINRCLDELKDLMVVTLQAEGENVSKLEKADILELTVRHLHKLKRHNALGLGGQDSVYADKFRAGFAHCATEVSNYLTSDVRSPPVEPSAGVKLLHHLGACMRKIDVDSNCAVSANNNNTANTTNNNNNNNNNNNRSAPDQYRPYTPPSTPGSELKDDPSSVWRPW